MEKVKRKIEEDILGVIRGIGYIGEIEVGLEHPAQEEHGDWSTNIALVVFAQLKNTPSASLRARKQKAQRDYKSPLELAEELVKRLTKNSDKRIENRELWSNIEEIRAVKPGFINFHLSSKVFSKELQLALKSGERYGNLGNMVATSDKKTMVLDHSHPNIAKRFGIGHLRSTIIGEALVNIYRFLGWKVVSDNFLGDWGTQFGSLIAEIEKKIEIGEIGGVGELSIDQLESLYVDFNKRAKEDPKLWEEAQKAFKRLESGDPQARKIWEEVKKISLQEFERIWELLGVKFDYIHPESFFEDKMQAVLDKAKEKKVSKTSQGALVIEIPRRKVPLMLLKSDGATTYETRDLAAIKFWKEQFMPDIIAYEVGSEQAQHFENVFAVSELLGYMPKNKLVHIQHGLYLSPDGKKMRTRTGGTVKLEEVLDEAVKRAKKLGEMRVIGDIGAVERENIAKMVGIGAIKYFDLSHQPSTNIIFDWENIFQLEGNSAPYLQYTYARCKSILGKVGEIGGIGDVGGINAEEMAILRHFYKFREVLDLSAKTYSPNLLCLFLFELAQRYNTFYARHKIVGEIGGIRGFRVELTQITANILKTGLNLLGIEAPERM